MPNNPVKEFFKDLTLNPFNDTVVRDYKDGKTKVTDKTAAKPAPRSYGDPLISTQVVYDIKPAKHGDKSEKHDDHPSKHGDHRGKHGEHSSKHAGSSSKNTGKSGKHGDTSSKLGTSSSKHADKAKKHGDKSKTREHQTGKSAQEGGQIKPTASETTSHLVEVRQSGDASLVSGTGGSSTSREKENIRSWTNNIGSDVPSAGAHGSHGSTVMLVASDRSDLKGTKWVPVDD